MNTDLIQVARQFRKLSQSRLAKEAGITQGYLSKVEQGVMTPDEATASKIAQHLNLPLSFFMQEHRVYGMPVSVHPMFRKKSKVGAKTLDAIQADLNIRLMHVRQLVNSIDLEPQFPLPSLDIDEYGGDAEKIATLVRRTWLLPRGPIKNLTLHLEQAGILVIENNFGGSDIDGVTLSVPGLPPCIFINTDRPADRIRFTLAHELGHIVMHQVPSLTMEDEANRFAAEFLMPATDIGPHLTQLTIPKLASYKRVWKTSMASILMRAKTLGKISHNQSSYLWRLMAPYRLKEPAETDFAPENPSVFPEIIKIHQEELGYSVSELAAMLNIYEEDAELMYQIKNKTGLRLIKS